MKRIISALLLICMLCTFIPFGVYAEDVNTPVFAESFEGENPVSAWTVYNQAYFQENVLGYSKNTDTAYITDGSNSLHYLDKNSEKYFAIATPVINLEKFGEYTLNVDARILSGKIRLEIRCFKQKNDSEYTKTTVWAYANSKMETYSLSYNITPETPYVKIVLMTDGGGSAEEGYIDNITFTNTSELDLEEYEAKKSIINAAANAKPGETIEIPDGTYNGLFISIANSGTESEPITLKAKNPGKVVLKGLSGIDIKGSYIVVSGIIFEECIQTPYIVNIQKGTQYCTIKECAIINCNSQNLTDDQRWISLNGQHHKITDCYLRGKECKGMMVEVLRIDGVPDYHIIENCYFGDFKYGTDNGFETIRIGTSANCSTDSMSVIRNCFFEKCDSEIEIISVKSCNNSIYNNTFYNCNGAVYSRAGNYNQFIGNLFIGGNKTERETGIVIYGDNNKVANNYFYNLPRTSVAFVAKNGNPLPEYFETLQPVTNMDVSNNTVVGCDLGFLIGEYSPDVIEKSNAVVAPEGKVQGNVLISYKGVLPQIKRGDTNNDVSYADNYVSGKKVRYDGNLPEGIMYGDLSYTASNGFLEFENGMGADINEVKKAPLNPYEVIPEWLKSTYYDSGVITFDIVKNDPFNTAFDVEDMLPSGNDINVILNGVRQSFSKDIYIKNGEIMVPVGELFEKLGGRVSVYQSTATAKKEDITIKFTKDSSSVKVDQRTKETAASIDYIDNDFFVPLGFTIENLCGYYDYLSDENTAHITIYMASENALMASYDVNQEYDNSISTLSLREYSEGALEDGTEENPWVVDTAEKFIEYFGINSDGEKLGDCFIQTADIVLPEDYRAYGQYEEFDKNRSLRFSGVYEGNGHSIDISMNDTEWSGYAFAGAFSVNKGTIKNLKVTGYINIPGGSYIGGIAGWNYGRIENCVNSADITASGTAGGITGRQQETSLTGIMSGCINTGNISGNSGNVGGLIGANNSDMILISCGNYGDIYSDARVGGLVGNVRGSITITKSFNAGDVTSKNKTASAFVGYASSGQSTSIDITDCFNIGKITSDVYQNALAIGVLSTDSEYAYSFRISNVYDIGNPDINVVAEGVEYTYDNVYIAGKYDATEETILNYFKNRDGWTVTEAFDYPNFNTVAYDPNFGVKVNVLNNTPVFLRKDDAEEVRTTDTNEVITSAYAIVAGKFSGVNTIKGVEYGVLISKKYSGEELTVETATKKARGIKHVVNDNVVSFGILIYGENMVANDTYYVRPYVKCSDKYYYGEPSSFVFPELVK